MGALDYKTRRHRRNRLAAELAATYQPRRHFRLGQDVGWHWQFDNPNDLYRRRNRLTYTRDFANAAWVKSGATATATRITATAGGSFHYAYQAQAIGTAGDAQTYTVEVSYVNNPWVFLNHPNDSSLTFFNTQTGAFGSIGGQVTSYSATLLPDGYYRVTIKAPVAASQPRAGVGLAVSSSSGSFAAAGTEAVDVRNAQNELGSTATEYQDVPTTWAQAYLDAVGAERIYAWTDTAGTTPNTAVGEGIGLLLGREYGGVRGVERVPSINWSGGSVADPLGSGFSVPAGGWKTYSAVNLSAMAVAANSLTFTATAHLAGLDGVALTGTSGKFNHYRIKARKTAQVSGTPSLQLYSGAWNEVVPVGATVGQWFTKDFHVQATVSPIISNFNGAASWEVEYLSVREIPGTHLTQATGTARPTLSARVNLLLATEQFDNAAWTKTGATISANAVAAPHGTLTADKIIETAANSVHQVSQINSSAVAGATYVYSVDVLAGERTSVAIILTDNATGDGRVIANLSAGTLGAASVSGNWSNPVASISASGGGWYRVKLTLTKTAGGNSSAVGIVALYNGATSYLGDGASGAYAWGADLRTADDAAKNIPAYQRVGATASDHDTDGFPHYALFDGTDDSWATVGTVDGSGSDKLTVVAAAATNSDAAIGMLFESTVAADGTAGGFYITHPIDTSGNFRVNSRGNMGPVSNQRDYGPYAAPRTKVVTATLQSAAADNTSAISVQVNGASVAGLSVNSGVNVGNYANATIYVGSRAGSSLRFNGRLYGSTGRFGPMSDSERNSLTRWWQKRIGTA